MEGNSLSGLYIRNHEVKGIDTLKGHWFGGVGVK